MTITSYQPGKRFAAAVRHNETLYIAGQVADSAGAPIDVQTREVLGKIDALLKEAGAGKAQLLSLNVYLAPFLLIFALNDFVSFLFQKSCRKLLTNIPYFPLFGFHC